MHLIDKQKSRWLSPGPVAGDTMNPQSLNRYAYAPRNPATLIDPSGLVVPPWDGWEP
jgi:RHS repeat-associated protein